MHHDSIAPLRCKNIPSNQFQKPIITIQGLALEAQCIKGALLLLLNVIGALKSARIPNTLHVQRLSIWKTVAPQVQKFSRACVFNDWYDAHNKRTTRRTKRREWLFASLSRDSEATCKEKDEREKSEGENLAQSSPRVVLHAVVLNLKMVWRNARNRAIRGDKRERNIDLMAQMQVTSHHSPHHSHGHCKVKSDRVKVELLLINRHLERDMYLLRQSRRPVAPYFDLHPTAQASWVRAITSAKNPPLISYWIF